ncbi:MAG: Bug family tripartite tricarboxylate transporter substrate binding protein [Burkholderiales bacterium]
MKNLRFAAMTAALCSAISTLATAQSYPLKPVRIIVPAGPGGPDIVARIVAANFTKQMGQTFFVENHGGANGIVGADMVAKAAPDGHTLMVYSSGFVVNQHVNKKLPYDTANDFAPVTKLIDNVGVFITVHPSVPVQSVKEFIDYARNPANKLAYSTPGVGNTMHIATELFNSKYGTQMTHIPYKGGGLAASAAVAGEVQVMFNSPSNVVQFARSGKLKVLAFSGLKRSDALPNIPTTVEAGVPEFVFDGGWFAMFAPARTNIEIVERLYREYRIALSDKATPEKIRALGIEPVGDTPAEFRKFFLAEIARYAEWVKLARIQPE